MSANDQLTVLAFACLTAVLALHARRFVALFNDSGVVDEPSNSTGNIVLSNIVESLARCRINPTAAQGCPIQSLSKPIGILGLRRQLHRRRLMRFTTGRRQPRFNALGKIAAQRNAWARVKYKVAKRREI